MPRILLLVHGLCVGGTEVLVADLARWLHQHGLGVEIGCLDEVGTIGEALREHGVPVLYYRRSPGKDFRLPWRIARHVRASSIDLMHAHQMTPFVYGAMAKLLARVPLVFTEHGRFHPDVSSVGRRAFNRVFGGAADRITAVSEAGRRSLVEVEGFHRDDIEVLYNGIDVERFSRPAGARDEARRRIGVPAAARVVGTVGRLHADKNFALLLRALPSLVAEQADVVLTIVGGGPEERSLRALAETLGISQRVFFLGERHDVEHIFPAFDVFALTSKTEGIPLTVLEAMAAGVPIVASAVGGVPEVLRDGVDALLVEAEPGSDDDRAATRFAAALGRALGGAAVAARLRDSAASRVRSLFSRDAIFRRYRAMYEDVLAGRSVVEGARASG